MQKITPCLWFDNNAEEAMNFYISVFKNGRVIEITHYDAASAEQSGQKEGSVLTCEFELFGQRFTALNGGPIFKFSEAVSFMVNVETQEELDELWNKLTENGGEESQCGWLKDKFGLSWQIVPTILPKLLADPDKEKASRVMKAMLSMKKLDIETLKVA